MLIKVIFLCFSILFFSVHAWASDFVKMVDEHGNFYYTNVIPGNKEDRPNNNSKQDSAKRTTQEKYIHPNRSLSTGEVEALSSEQIRKIEQEIEECISKHGAGQCRQDVQLIHKFATASKWYVIHDEDGRSRALSEKWFSK